MAIASVDEVSVHVCLEGQTGSLQPGASSAACDPERNCCAIASQERQPSMSVAVGRFRDATAFAARSEVCAPIPLSCPGRKRCDRY